MLRMVAKIDHPDDAVQQRAGRNLTATLDELEKAGFARAESEAGVLGMAARQLRIDRRRR